MKPRLLDLFCGAGGCSVGYHRAGFEVVGVDIKPQPRYPFTFIQGDALETLKSIGERFDVIHASPPCQGYSISRNNGCHKDAPLLIGDSRERLVETGKPFVIENVIGAPLHNLPLFGFFVVTLCGANFGLRSGDFDLARHRLFESNLPIKANKCSHRKGQTIGVYGNGTNKFHREKFGRCIRESEKREAMAIDWMSRKELTQAIPPAYTEFIGKQLMDMLESHWNDAPGQTAENVIATMERAGV